MPAVTPARGLLGQPFAPGAATPLRNPVALLGRRRLLAALAAVVAAGGGVRSAAANSEVRTPVRERRGKRGSTRPGRRSRSDAATARSARRKHGGKPGKGSSLALGIFEDQVPGSAARLRAFQSQWGREPALVMWFQAWGGDNRALDTDLLDRVVAVGAVPEITWEPWKPGAGVNQPAFALRAIARGDHDDYVAGWADGLRDWGGAVYLRLAHEMNGNWYPWAVGGGANGNTAADYVAAWRHVVGIFRDRGARNVRWIWCPNVKYPGSAPLGPLYPGNGWVDWIGMDGYNWASAAGDADWLSVGQLFGPTYKSLAGKGRPMLIAETACAGSGDDKSAWIRDGFLAGVPKAMPKVKAVTYFNLDKERNWAVDHSAGNEAAFREVCDSDRYGGAMPGGQGAAG